MRIGSIVALRGVVPKTPKNMIAWRTYIHSSHFTVNTAHGSVLHMLAGGLHDGTERCSGYVSPFVIVHVLPTDKIMIQCVFFTPQNARDNNGEEHGEIKKCVQASNDHESPVFSVCDISTARQEFVHLLSISQECTKCQSWKIKGSQITGIVTMRGLTSKNDTPPNWLRVRGRSRLYIPHNCTYRGRIRLLHQFQTALAVRLWLFSRINKSAKRT